MKKKIFKKITIGLLPLSLVVVPLASCSNQLSLNTNHNSSENWNPNIDGLPNDVKFDGTIDKEITEFIAKPVYIELVDLSKNTTYDKLESINNFLKFNIDKSYVNQITQEGILGDAYAFINSIFNDNKSAFSMNLNATPNISVTNELAKQEGISQKRVSLDLSIGVLNDNNKVLPFKLLSNTYDLNANTKYTLNISIKDEIPSFSINSVNDRYFLGLKFNNVNFVLNDDNNKELGNFTLNSFSFTPNSFSYNFKKEFLYLTNQSDYNDVLANKTINDILKNKTDEEFKQELLLQFKNNQEQYKNVLEMINNIFKSISLKENLEAFISKNAPGVLMLLSKFNVVNLKDNVKTLITDLLNQDNSVVEIILKDKQYILELIKDLVGNNQLILSMASNILDLVKPNLSEEEQQNIVDQIKSLFGLIGNSGNQYLFIADLVKDLLSGVNVYDFIKSALSKPEVKNLINDLPANIKPLVDFLIKIVEGGDLSSDLISVVFKHKDELISLINTLVPNETLKKVLDVLITSNPHFTADKMYDIFNKSLYSLTDGLLKNLKQEGNSRFEKFEYNRETKEFSFDFVTTYVIAKENNFRWELQPIIDLLPDTFNLKDFGLDTAAIEKLVSEAAKGAAELNTSKGKEWYIFKKKDILGFIPPYIDFSVGDSLEFTNSADKQQIWLNPTSIGSKQFFGYSVPTVSSFRLNLPGGVQSIVSQYDSKKDKNYFGFTKLFIEFLTQQHDFYENVSVVDTKNEITDGLVYNNDLYINNVPYDWKITINKEFKDKVKTNANKEILTTYNAKTKDNTDVELHSYKLTNSLTQEELGTDLIKDYDKVFKNSQYKPFIMLNQISNFTDQTISIPLNVKAFNFLPLTVHPEAKISNFTFMVSSYLPFKTYNSKKEFVDYLYSQSASHLIASISINELGVNLNETLYNDWIL